MAPRPRVLYGVKQGDRIEVRPGESVFLFLEQRVGAGRTITGLNQRTPFRIVDAKPPAGTPQPRTFGRWLRIDVARGTKAGTADRVAIETRPVVPRALGWVEARFTLVAGNQRFY